MSASSLVVVGGAEGRTAAETLVRALRASGREVDARHPLSALAYGLPRRDRLECVVSCGPSTPAHAVGATLRRAGVPWIAHHPRPWPAGSAWGRRIGSRLMRMADVATVADPPALEDLHLRAHVNAVELDPARVEGLVALARAWRAPARGLRVLVIGPTNSPHVEDFALALRRQGAEVFAAGLPWGGSLGPSALPGAGIYVSSATWPATLWVRRLMRELRPAVVHAHWLPYAVTARLGGARPLVATAWGSDVYLATPRRRATYRWVVRRSEAVLADSADLLAELRRLGAPPARSRVFSWGLDRTVFSPPTGPREAVRESLGVAPGPVMLSARGFKDIYNPDVVIAAFELLAERRPDLQLVLKHNSAEPPRLPPLRFPDRVHVVGREPRERLAEWFRAATVCVSLASSDSSPRSVWEAMSCGCPCVISDLPWARQELEPGKHALLVPVEAEAVAAAVGSVLDDGGLAAALAAAGLSHVTKNHDRAVEMQRMIELYWELALSDGA